MTNHSFALLHVDLVANHDKWEALRVHRAGLHQELVPPAVQCVEALGVVDVVDEHAAVGATVEGHAQRLEALLSSGIPQLLIISLMSVSGGVDHTPASSPAGRRQALPL